MILNASLAMEAQISSATWSGFYHIWLIRQLVPYLIPKDLVTVTHAMVTSRLVTVTHAVVTSRSGHFQITETHFTQVDLVFDEETAASADWGGTYVDVIICEHGCSLCCGCQ